MAPEVAPGEGLGERLGLLLRYSGSRREIAREPQQFVDVHAGFEGLRHCGHSPRPSRTSSRRSITGNACSGSSIK